MKSSTFIVKDGLEVPIYVYLWEPEDNPRAIVHLIHGMAEHAARYERVAMELTKIGCVCIADDHHGHGKSVSSIEEAGKLPGNYLDIVNSVHLVTETAKEKFPNLPVFVVGHSWGSFLSQYYIQNWGNELKGCILSGTSGSQPMLGLSRFLAKTICKFKGKDSPAKLLDKFAFGAFAKVFKPPRTDFDWLSRDNDEVDKYIEDPFCGFLCSNGYFLELMNLLTDVWNPEHEKQIPVDLPIFFIAGELDPVSTQTTTIKQIIDRYELNGIQDISSKFYPEARHEVFNETNREEVLKDVSNWIADHL